MPGSIIHPQNSTHFFLGWECDSKIKKFKKLIERIQFTRYFQLFLFF